eukprot:634390-Pelagomonas_calceolata.AAC.2
MQPKPGRMQEELIVAVGWMEFVKMILLISLADPSSRKKRNKIWANQLFLTPSLLSLLSLFLNKVHTIQKVAIP